MLNWLSPLAMALRSRSSTVRPEPSMVTVFSPQTPEPSAAVARMVTSPSASPAVSSPYSVMVARSLPETIDHVSHAFHAFAGRMSALYHVLLPDCTVSGPRTVICSMSTPSFWCGMVSGTSVPALITRTILSPLYVPLISSVPYTQIDPLFVTVYDAGTVSFTPGLILICFPSVTVIERSSVISAVTDTQAPSALSAASSSSAVAASENSAKFPPLFTSVPVQFQPSA